MKKTKWGLKKETGTGKEKEEQLGKKNKKCSLFHD